MTMMLFRMGGLLHHASPCFPPTMAWSPRVESAGSGTAPLTQSQAVNLLPLSLHLVSVACWWSSRTQHDAGISEAPPSYC